MDAQGVQCARRRILSPDLVDQAIARHGAPQIEHEQGEDGALACARDRERTTRPDHLQRPEDAELHVGQSGTASADQTGNSASAGIDPALISLASRLPAD